MRRTFKIDIYHIDVEVRFVRHVIECAKGIYAKHGFNYYDYADKQDADDRGNMFEFGGTYYVIYNVGCLTHGLIAHEVKHVVDAVEKQLGSHEVEGTYLTEYIINKIYGFIADKNLTVGVA